MAGTTQDTRPDPTARRLHGIPPTVFSEMSALAVSTGSVNLGQGFPDVDGPASALERAAAALHEGRNQYAPGTGVPELRQAIAAHQRRHYGLDVDPDSEVVVTTGATEGVAAAVLGLVDPGDEVVVLEPWYDSYPAMLQVAGAVRARGDPARARTSGSTPRPWRRRSPTPPGSSCSTPPTTRPAPC